MVIFHLDLQKVLDQQSFQQQEGESYRLQKITVTTFALFFSNTVSINLVSICKKQWQFILRINRANSLGTSCIIWNFFDTYNNIKI